MDGIFLTHYYFSGTDPWKNIMLLSEEESFSVAKELADEHPGEPSFGRFADYENYYPARKAADEYVRRCFISRGGDPELTNPYAFTLGECDFLNKWFSNGEKLILNLNDIPDSQISFTMGDSCSLVMRGESPEVMTKAMLLDKIRSSGDSVEALLHMLPEGFGYIEAQLWKRLG